MPRTTATISGKQREAIYEFVLERLGRLSDLPLVIKQEDFDTARRLARELSGDLRLHEDLGWGEDERREVALTMPPEGSPRRCGASTKTPMAPSGVPGVRLRSFARRSRRSAFRLRHSRPSARELREGARGGDGQAAAELLALADENPEDAELYLDFLAPLRHGEIAAFVRSEPEAAGRIAAAMSRHVREDFHGNFDHMNIPLRFILDIAALAAEHSEFGLLEDVAAVLFEAEASCVRYEQRRRTRSWLEGLRGQAAAVVARSLAAVPAGAEWHLEEDWSPARQSDPQIRGAFHAAATAAAQ